MKQNTRNEDDITLCVKTKNNPCIVITKLLSDIMIVGITQLQRVNL